MPLHLLKLGVGVESIQFLEELIAGRLAEKTKRGLPREQIHTTRMIPKRAAELLDGGSMYWVIRGQIAVRQRLLDVRPFTDGEGISRCHLVLEPVLQAVMPRPRRPFQGWRYLTPDDAPPDIEAGASELAEMPETLRRELRELGLL